VISTVAVTAKVRQKADQMFVIPTMLLSVWVRVAEDLVTAIATGLLVGDKSVVVVGVCTVTEENPLLSRKEDIADVDVGVDKVAANVLTAVLVVVTVYEAVAVPVPPNRNLREAANVTVGVLIEDVGRLSAYAMAPWMAVAKSADSA
jgi:hypothetical protein